MFFVNFPMLSPVRKRMPAHCIRILVLLNLTIYYVGCKTLLDLIHSQMNPLHIILWLQKLYNRARESSNARSKAPIMPNPAMNHEPGPVFPLLHPYILTRILTICHVSSNCLVSLCPILYPHILCCILTFYLVSSHYIVPSHYFVSFHYFVSPHYILYPHILFCIPTLCLVYTNSYL